MFEKLKSLLAEDRLFYSVLIVLVAVVSFGLGRQSGLSLTQDNTDKASNYEVSVLQPQASQATALTAPAGEEATTAAAVVASKSGTKYHLPTCPGAKQIKPENLITFESIEAAKAAGYNAAANCPGL
jgi:hypothetical protein